MVKATMAGNEHFASVSNPDRVVTIRKAAATPNLPEGAYTAPKTARKVSDISLPADWSWKSSDASKPLIYNKAVRATAVYTGLDQGNYVTESVVIAITKTACGHEQTELKNGKEATYTTEGYTGDQCCSICGTKLAEGTTIPRLAMPQAGISVKDTAGVTYKITKSAAAENGTVTPGTVAYEKPKNKSQKTIKIPDTVTLEGIPYEVTSIGANAFKNNRKLKKLTIGKNITTIGKSAFYGCKSLKSIIIKTTQLTSKRVGSKAFKGIYKKATIKVPKKQLKSYKKLLKAKGVSSTVKIKK